MTLNVYLFSLLAAVSVRYLYVNHYLFLLHRELDVSEPPLYSSEGIHAIAGLEIINKSALYGLLARILDGSRLFEFKARSVKQGKSN